MRCYIQTPCRFLRGKVQYIIRPMSALLTLPCRTAEKLREWPEEPFSLAEILTSTSLWWFTESAARSVYTYRLTFGCSDYKAEYPYFDKPFGYSWFMHELMPAPRKNVDCKGDLVFYRQHEKVSASSSLTNAQQADRSQGWTLCCEGTAYPIC